MTDRKDTKHAAGSVDELKECFDELIKLRTLFIARLETEAPGLLDDFRRFDAAQRLALQHMSTV